MENKKILGVPFIKSEKWTGLGWSILTMIFCYALTAVLTLVITGEFQESVRPQTTVIAIIAGTVVFHLFKFLTNKWVKTSYYSPLTLVLQAVGIIIGYFIIVQQ